MKSTVSFSEPWKGPLQRWAGQSCDSSAVQIQTPKTIKLQNQLSLHIQVMSADARARPDLLGDPRQRPPEVVATRLSLEGNPGQAGRLTDR